MGADVREFIAEMAPVYTALAKMGDNRSLITDTEVRDLDQRIQGLLSNRNYASILGSPERTLLTALDKCVITGQCSNLANRVDYLNKLISQTLIDKKNPKAAVEIAAKIGKQEWRDEMLYESIKKMPLETPLDFAEAIKLSGKILSSEFKANVLYRSILVPLYAKYEITFDPSYLNEIFAAAVLIPKDESNQFKQWQDLAFLKLAGYFNERPELRAEFNDKLSFELIGEEYVDPETEKQLSCLSLINVFKKEKANPIAIVDLILSLKDLNEKYNEVRKLWLEYYSNANKDGEKITAPILEKLSLEVMAQCIENNDFQGCLEILPRLPKQSRESFTAAMLDKAEKEIHACIGKNELLEAQQLLHQFGEDADSVAPLYKDKWIEWNAAVEVALTVLNSDESADDEKA